MGGEAERSFKRPWQESRDSVVDLDNSDGSSEKLSNLEDI